MPSVLENIYQRRADAGRAGQDFNSMAGYGAPVGAGAAIGNNDAGAARIRAMQMAQQQQAAQRQIASQNEVAALEQGIAPRKLSQAENIVNTFRQLFK